METNKRPKVILILAWLLIILHGRSVLLIPFSYGLFSPERSISIGVINIVLFISAIGILKLKKWSPYLYIAGSALNLASSYLYPIKEYEHLMTSGVLIGQVVFFIIIVTILMLYRSRFASNQLQKAELTS